MNRSELLELAKEVGAEISVTMKNAELEEAIRIAKENKEIEAKAGGYEQPTEESKKANKAEIGDAKAKISARQKATRLVRAMIVPLDEKMRDVPSELFSVGTPKLGFIKQVVQFHNDILMWPECIVAHIEEKRALLQVTTTVRGKRVTIKKFGAAYNVKRLPDYTIEELKELGVLKD